MLDEGRQRSKLASSVQRRTLNLILIHKGKDERRSLENIIPSLRKQHCLLSPTGLLSLMQDIGVNRGINISLKCFLIMSGRCWGINTNKSCLQEIKLISCNSKSRFFVSVIRTAVDYSFSSTPMCIWETCFQPRFLLLKNFVTTFWWLKK